MTDMPRIRPPIRSPGAAVSSTSNCRLVQNARARANRVQRLRNCGGGRLDDYSEALHIIHTYNDTACSIRHHSDECVLLVISNIILCIVKENNDWTQWNPKTVTYKQGSLYTIHGGAYPNKWRAFRKTFVYYNFLVV